MFICTKKKTMVSVSDTPNRKPVVNLSINGLIWFDQICLVKIARIQSLNNWHCLTSHIYNMAPPQAICHYLTIDIFVAWTNTYLQAAKIGKIMSELTSHAGWIHSRHCRWNYGISPLYPHGGSAFNIGVYFMRLLWEMCGLHTIFSEDLIKSSWLRTDLSISKWR